MMLALTMPWFLLSCSTDAIEVKTWKSDDWGILAPTDMSLNKDPSPSIYSHAHAIPLVPPVAACRQ